VQDGPSTGGGLAALYAQVQRTELAVLRALARQRRAPLAQLHIQLRQSTTGHWRQQMPRTSLHFSTL